MSNCSTPRPALLSLLALLALSLPMQAEIRKVTVAVDGMSCPFCAFGVEKRLRKVEGVESVEISTRDGTATAVANVGGSVAIEKIPAAVEAAGFTPGIMVVEAVGILSREAEGGLVLDVGGAKLRLRLTFPGGGVPGGVFELLDSGAPVIVRGPFGGSAQVREISVESISQVPES